VTRFVAVASRDPARAQRFASELGLEAGKHVLWEKPFATSPADATRCFDAAEAAGRVVEGFMWAPPPQTVLGVTGEEADAYRIEFAVV
jgi:predicted dehydrogenase